MEAGSMNCRCCFIDGRELHATPQRVKRIVLRIILSKGSIFNTKGISGGVRKDSKGLEGISRGGAEKRRVAEGFF
jgi:hypothetical protein